MGVSSAVSNVTLNGAAIESGWSYDSTSKVLAVTELNDLTCDGAWTNDWELRWQ